MSNRIATPSPAAHTKDLIAEVIFWHNATGNSVTVEQIFARGRSCYIHGARSDCIRRLRQVKGWSYPRLARFFNLDHSTIVHHATRKIVANARTFYSPDVQTKKQRLNEQARAKKLLLPPKPRGNRRRDAEGNIIRRKDRLNGMANTTTERHTNGNQTQNDAIQS